MSETKLSERQLTLSLHLYPTGYHVAAWRLPEVPADAGLDFSHLYSLVETAENSLFDFVFLPDSLTFQGRDIDALSRTAIRYVSQLEPITLLSAFASRTKYIGLVASATTTYHDPFHIARMFLSLDHISGGRAGWNIITSQNGNEAELFGLVTHPAHADRYQRAEEFAALVHEFWGTWGQSALVRDKQSGIFFCPEHLNRVEHHGRYFNASGMLSIPPSPQGKPLIVQAGSSETGRDLSAKTADIVFTAQNNIDDAKAFYTDVKRRAAAYGRPKESFKVLVGVSIFAAETAAEAWDKFNRLQALVHPTVGLSLLSIALGGADLSDLPLDVPLTTRFETNGSKSREELIAKLVDRDGMTLRQLYEKFSSARGHLELIGSYRDVVDTLEQWFQEFAADGFNIMPATFPGGLDDVVQLVIPELQRRGIFRREYQGATLRERVFGCKLS